MREDIDSRYIGFDAVSDTAEDIFDQNFSFKSKIRLDAGLTSFEQFVIYVLYPVIYSYFRAPLSVTNYTRIQLSG